MLILFENDMKSWRNGLKNCTFCNESDFQRLTAIKDYDEEFLQRIWLLKTNCYQREWWRIPLGTTGIWPSLCMAFVGRFIL